MSSCFVMQIKQRTPRQLVEKYELNQPLRFLKVRVSAARIGPEYSVKMKFSRSVDQGPLPDGAMLQEFADRGEYADVPVDQIAETFRTEYPLADVGNADFDADVDLEVRRKPDSQG